MIFVAQILKKLCIFLYILLKLICCSEDSSILLADIYSKLEYILMGDAKGGMEGYIRDTYLENKHPCRGNEKRMKN